MSMSRSILEVVVELIAVNLAMSGAPMVPAVVQLVLAIRGHHAKSELARIVTIATAIAATTISLAVRVYEPIGAATPAPEVSVYSYVLVYSFGPILVASVATALEAIIRLVREPGTGA